MTCTRCGLSTTRKSIAVGRGDLSGCDIVFLGEAPDAAEDSLGEAFIGPAYKLLLKMITQSRLSEYRTKFINIVWCYPTNRKGGSRRDPTPTEIVACMSNVLEAIDYAAPRQVVFLGDVVKKYYKRAFPLATTIQQPSYLIKTGGEISPSYLKNVRLLEDLYARM